MMRSQADLIIPIDRIAKVPTGDTPPSYIMACNIKKASRILFLEKHRTIGRPVRSADPGGLDRSVVSGPAGTVFRRSFQGR
jgi:hypothetical protein